MNTPKTQTAVIQSQQHDNVTWLDVLNPDAETFAKLESIYNLHPIHLHESVQKVQHNQVEREDGYLFLVLHFPVFNVKKDKLLISQVGVFLGKNYVITIRAAACHEIDALYTSCQDDTTTAKSYFGQGSAYLLHSVISKMLSSIATMTENVELELDEIEDLVFDDNASDAQRIGKVRQQIVRLRRVIGPKKMLLLDLAEQIDSFSKQNMAKYYANDAKTVNKLWETIEEAKETVEIYKDADFTVSTEQTNRILAVLTIIFTLTIR